MAKIVGRKKEQQQLEHLLDSKEAEFLVVYGRRRVGKTFLIRNYFKDRLTFYHTALSPLELEGGELLQAQLQNFTSSLRRSGMEIDAAPQSWFEAFDLLIDFLSGKPKTEKIIVFIDEMPWLDTPKSGFVTAFEHFWNGWAAGQDNLLLVACGSATTWIVDRLLSNKGGLYNRVTQEMHLTPFTLKECEEYYREHGVVMDRYDQVQCYMAIGGIPYYMSFIDPGYSLAQNIDRLLFTRNGLLTLEFGRLFGSLFSSPEPYKQVIRLLADYREGLKREDIAKLLNMSSGGTLSKLLEALVVSDFVTRYQYFGKSKREVYYKLTDFYSLFYIRFVEKGRRMNVDYWQNNQLTPSVTAWRGLAFEDVCMVHVQQIRQALGILGVQSEASPWHYVSVDKKMGAQIDLLINRSDRIVDICEMKFCVNTYRMDKKADESIRNKIQVVMDTVRGRKAIHPVIVTTYGLAKNEYSSRIQRVITMDDLFC